MNEYQANIYPGNVTNPTITHADSNRKSIAVCFSGGGSRALTCAWGQLIGLNTLKRCAIFPQFQAAVGRQFCIPFAPRTLPMPSFLVTVTIRHSYIMIRTNRAV
ncbi:MAG: Uncharacterized protein CG442_1096 [Methylococcaceae bacterium NSO1]|nr:MAG: Uncharacterized protein CG442_1096 [Methylococcaceae bacterium NSO1]